MPPAMGSINLGRGNNTLTSTLHDACATGDYNTVRRMVEDAKKAQAKASKKLPGASRTWEKLEGNVNDVDETGRSPLHYAIESGHEDIIR